MKDRYEIRYLFFYYYHAQVSSYKYQKKNSHSYHSPGSHSLTTKIVNVYKPNTIISIFVFIRSAFLVTFTAPNKQLPYVKPIFKSVEHVSNSEEIYKLTTSP